MRALSSACSSTGTCAPHWLGYAIQRPEAHYRHRAGYPARNYASLALWDILFGTFDNPRRTPDDLTDRVGFADGRGRHFWAMLSGRDVNAEVPAFRTVDRA
jgi:sterol desaturase/sphingolipid hydroxylase (fatty acid hydroxylase superfamily)